MDDILIPCPKCGKELRLRDPKLLGRTGKCPKCSHRFKLEEPEDEVELELADQTAVPVGTAAQWVPDNQPAASGAPAAAAAPAAEVPAFPVGETGATSSIDRLRPGRKKKPDKLKIAVIAGTAVTGLAVTIAIIIAASGSPEKKPASGKGNSAGNTAAVDPAGDGAATNPDGLVDDGTGRDAPLDDDLPPSGQPITLNYIPTGARMVIHLRPAEIWKTQSDAETVVLCLGGLGVWTKNKLTELLLFEPKDIEEATICLYLDDRNSPPEVAYRVTLTQKQQRSEFIDKFGGNPHTDYGRRIYITEETDERPATAYMITDQIGREFASAPKAKAKEMVDAEANPGLAFGGIDQLLKRTDHRRHLTVLFDPSDLRNSKQFLFPESAHNLLGHFLVRFEDAKMDTVAWSFHFGDQKYDKFFSEILLRNKVSAISSYELKDDMNRKLESLPEELLGAVQRMQPTLVAEREFVGRLPAMFKAYYMQTSQTNGGPSERWVRLTTVLPKVAGPNLAAASMFAWQLAQTTDFSQPAPKQPSKKIPELIADRLKLPVDIDFRRTPLQKAMAFIGEETFVRVEIDGDALKDAGYTQNMPQNMKLGQVSGVRALGAILKQYDKMVISVDEQKKVMIVTTRKFAAQKGQPIFELAE